jgi:methylamine utilization protein MauE
MSVLSVVFAWSGLTKIFRPQRWREHLRIYRLPRPLRALGFLMLPWAELGIGGLALAGYPKVAAGLTVTLLAIFSAAIVRARIVTGANRLACGCFTGNAVHDYRLMLSRNGVLIGLALVVLFSGRLLGINSVLSPEPVRSIAMFAGLTLTALPWMLAQLRARLGGQ